MEELNEKALEQINNDASVIGYQPELKYVKDRTATGEILTSEKDTYYDETDEDENYTKALNSFMRNCPSNTLNDIAYVLDNIKRLKLNLAEKFNEEQAYLDNPFYNVNTDPLQGHNGTNSNGTGLTGSPSTSSPPFSSELGNKDLIIPNGNTGKPYDPAKDINTLIEASDVGDTDYAQRFEENYDKVSGTVIPSLINFLTDIEKKLEELAKTLGEVYYNNPKITVPDAREIDDSYISSMKDDENNNNYHKINYMTISYDSILNRTISFNVFRDNKNAIKVAKVIDSHGKTQATKNDMDIINKLFNDVQKELELRARGYKRQDDIDLIQKSLYNYYEKRKNLNDLYKLRQKDKTSTYLGRKVDEYANNLMESIKDVNRVLMYNQTYLDKIAILEKEKYNIQKIYRSTSSNK